jgi:photosystem II stability/assembly factor-like uncharacterized protein
LLNRLIILLLAATAVAQSWVPQASNTTASLRGVSAVNERVVWASGSGGTYLRTTDGGTTWIAAKVPGAESLDFRAIRAIDERTVFLLSIGSGDKSRVYKTTDAGEHWTLQFTQPDPQGFFDAIAFWDATHGILLGDALGGSAEVRTTDDGGLHWTRQQTPPALEKEGSFAASNSCLVVRGKKDAWYVTGGPGAGRVFHSKDGGRHWSVTPTAIRNDGAAAGIFSIAFADARHGMAVGGDYSKDKENAGNIVVTSDGGRIWTAPTTRPAGFRSAVVYLVDRKTWIVAGTSGSDISVDGGATWKLFDSGSYNALSFVSGTTGWAVGGRGRVAKFQP